MKTRNIESITLEEIKEVADENDIEYFALTKIIGDVKDKLTEKTNIIIPSLSINDDVKRKYVKSGKYRKNDKRVINHFTKTQTKRIITLFNKGLKPRKIAEKLNDVPKRITDKIEALKRNGDIKR